VVRLGSFVGQAFALCAIVTVLSACSSAGQTAFGPLAGANPSAVDSLGRVASWMSPSAKTMKRLLYVSDDAYASYSGNAVYVYSYPKGKLVGILSGFESPEGECVDGAGDVFITDYDAQDIVEYAHGGTTPINTLSNSGKSPVGCSVDPTTGNLAVTDWNGPPSHLAIYQNAQGNPTYLSDKYISQMKFCGFDNKGNLFVDGEPTPHYGETFSLSELPKGSSDFVNVTPSEQYVNTPGAVQWDGKYVAFEDPSVDTIYQEQVGASSGEIVGETVLSGSDYVTQFWVVRPDTTANGHRGTRVVGADNQLPGVEFWEYPNAGNAPIKEITGAPFVPSYSVPFGVTVSITK
jgi:hypothetical protein